MASKFVVFACLQAFALQSALAQVILPQYQQFLSSPIVEAVPNCGCGYPQVVPQVLSLPQQVVQVPQQVVQVPQQLVPTTVVQDSSVSNNLANALQLLVVSNLLSNTLPFNEAEIVVPYGGVVEQVPYVGGYYSPQVVSSPCGCGGYSVPSCGCGGLSTLNGLGSLVGIF